MFLQKLTLINFKNHEQAELSFSPRINCLAGNNGTGKTNILDAIHYLSFTKSYFNTIDSQNINFDKDFFVIQGILLSGENTEDIYCAVKRNKKKQFFRNKKEYTRFSDHIGTVPTVMVSPADSSLIYEPEERRKFINMVIVQYDKEYLDELIAYESILSQRNKFLKKIEDPANPDLDAIEAWNEGLSSYGTRIFEKRKYFIEHISPYLTKYYNFISNGKEKVSIEYESDLLENDFGTLLRNSLRKDLYLQHTTCGIHRDDLVFKTDMHNMRKFGSQGQHKTYLVSLKLAEYEYIRNITKRKPLLMFDDMFDKFDIERTLQIIALLSDKNFGQIFITDTNLEQLKEITEGLEAETKIFNIGQNNIIETIL